MLHITIPEGEWFNEVTNRFYRTKKCELNLEHSLIAISKWESKIKRPFPLIQGESMTLEEKSMTLEEESYYIRCMCINQSHIPNEVFDNLPDSVRVQVREYIVDPMTASVVKTRNKQHSSKMITSELIYYWMISLNIPFECEKWNFNRLMTLIQVTSIESSAGKDQMTQSEVAQYHQQVNQARRKALAEKKGLSNVKS